MLKKKISIEDVAKRAKVSITTVSRVINNVSTVSNKNRSKVEEAVAFLKFKPNVSAQRLAKGVNTSIGLVMPGYPGIFHSFYAIELIRGIGHACETMRLDMVFHITNGYNPLNTNTVGGVIFADIIENRRQVESALAIGTPCMIINNEEHELPVDYIAVDNHEGGRIAADYLISLGHKRIAVITGNLNTQAGLYRFEGFRDYMKSKKVNLPEEYVYKGDYSRRCARVAAEEFFNLKDMPTAIFASSDEMALEVIAVCNEKGINVPDDVSILGFDDSPACLYSSIGLTTIRQPIFEMAEKAVHVLSEIVNGRRKEKHHVTLDPELVVRESCKTAPRNRS